MSRRLKAIAAAAAIITPVALVATPAAAQIPPSIAGLWIIGPDWEEPIDDEYVVYEDELPAEWSILADSPDAESMTWTIDGDVETEEEEQPYFIKGDFSGDWNPFDPGPGTYVITATAHENNNQRGATGEYSVTLTIEPGSRPSFDHVVNSGRDAHDTVPGDGVCAAFLDGLPHCTLRAAIEEANANGGGRIALKDYVEGYELELGELDITTPIGIFGLGDQARIDAMGNSRVFDINSPRSFTMLDNLAIQGGDATLSGFDESNGGNIRALGSSLWLQNSTVADGRAIRGGGIDFTEGGNDAAVLHISHSTLERNSAGGVTSDGGGALFAGGEVVVSVETSVIVDNFGIFGGGIAVDGVAGQAELRVNNTVIAHNEAWKGGSGINVSDTFGEISYSTIADNLTIRTNLASAGPVGSGGLYSDNPSDLELNANAVVGNSFEDEGRRYSAECASPLGTSFTFRPGNYVEEVGDVCRVDLDRGTRTATAANSYGVPAYVGPNRSATDDYVVGIDSPLRGLGIGSDAYCHGYDVYGNRRGLDGACAAGAVAYAAPASGS